MVIDSKKSTLGYGWIEIVERSDGWFELRVGGRLAEQSKDLSYIRSEYNKY